MMLGLMILVVSAASAQFKGRGGVIVRPYTSVAIGGFYPFFSYNPYYYGYPLYATPYAYRPSKLDLQIADIKHDFDDRIASVKMDESLKGKMKREKIRELKTECKDAVYAAKRNYYKS